MEEEWRVVPIEGCEDYMVSNYGNVKLLPRDVETHIAGRGRDMIVTAHRKGKMLKATFDGGRQTVRLKTKDGKRKKLSLPLLVLRAFKADECPGDINVYTAAYLDEDKTNNRVDNLVWIPKSMLMSSISSSTKGEPKPHLSKYNYYLIQVNGYTVGYFNGTNEAEELFKSYGFDTSASAIGRSLKSGKPFYYLFDLVPVTQLEYVKVCVDLPQMDLKMLYNIIMEDRRHNRKNVVKEKIKIKKVPVIKYKDKIVVKEIPVEKIVEKVVYVEKPVEVKNEEVKKETQMLVNDRTTNDKKAKRKTVKTGKTKKPVLDDIEGPTLEDLQDIEKDIFKQELLRRLR